MKYIIELPERKNCSRCPITHSEFDVCCVTATNIREYLYDDNATKPLDCPLKPLKVKELEWSVIFELNNDIYYQSNGLDCVYQIRIITGHIYCGKIGTSNEVNTLDEAKSFCQQHYENMILSELEEK